MLPYKCIREELEQTKHNNCKLYLKEFEFVVHNNTLNKNAASTHTHKKN